MRVQQIWREWCNRTSRKMSTLWYRASRPELCGHSESDDSLLKGTIVCTVGCSEACLVSIHWMPVTVFDATTKTIPRYGAKSPFLGISNNYHWECCWFLNTATHQRHVKSPGKCTLPGLALTHWLRTSGAEAWDSAFWQNFLDDFF